ncbi:hypothetical protein ASB57_25290 [Bordetella sp. N]|nr:hypothetical protein ASB57_25290 [Bordetella sp. N]
MLSPRIAGLCLVALLSACSSSGTKTDGGPDGESSFSTTSAPTPATTSGVSCKSNRSSCLYNGAYESDERNYAQKQAAKLNLAELERLKRGLGQ